MPSNKNRFNNSTKTKNWFPYANIYSSPTSIPSDNHILLCKSYQSINVNTENEKRMQKKISDPFHVKAKNLGSELLESRSRSTSAKKHLTD